MNKYHAKAAKESTEARQGYNRSKTRNARTYGLNDDPATYYGQNGYTKQSRQEMSEKNKAHRNRYK